MNAISIDYVAATKLNGAWGKVAMIRCLLLTVALRVPIATSSQPGTVGPKPDVETYFRQSIGLSQDQIASIRNGKASDKISALPQPGRSFLVRCGLRPCRF